VLLVLAVKVSHRRHRAAQVSFWLYAIDTLVITLSFAASIATFRTAIVSEIGIFSPAILLGHCQLHAFH